MYLNMTSRPISKKEKIMNNTKGERNPQLEVVILIKLSQKRIEQVDRKQEGHNPERHLQPSRPS